MRTAVDSNICSAIWSDEPTAPEMIKTLWGASREGSLVVSAVAYAELLAHPRVPAKMVPSLLRDAGISVDFALAEPVWTMAGLRFEQYCERRRRATGEFPRRLIADFLIGAHAVLAADRLLTTDINRYRTYFPELVQVPIAADV